MTDKKKSDPAAPANADKPEKAAQAPAAQTQSGGKSNFAKAAADGKSAKGGKGKPNKAATSSSGGSGWTWLLVLLILLAGGAAAAWYQWPPFRTWVSDQVANLRGDKPPASPATDTAAERDRPSAEVSRAAPAARPEAPSAAPAPIAAPAEAPTTSETAPANPVAEQSAQNSSPDTSPVTPAAPQPDPAAALDSTVNQLQQALQVTLQQVNRQQQTIQQLQQQLAAMQRDVTAQGSRIGELGNISRDDWQLAEADYLLRLANQRLLMDRDSRTALGLLEEVDQILQRVDNPDLYGVRQQLARDITALKLVDNIDREGLYLRLRALEEQMLRASIQPEFDIAKTATEVQTDADTSANPSDWRRSWDNFVSFLKDSVRIRDGDIDPVLLSPQSEARFRQSLRLNMEQAELAVLREDATVYKDALNRAKQLLLDYAIANNQRDVLVSELEALANENIRSELPPLNASQKALRDYIDRLHSTGTSGENAS